MKTDIKLGLPKKVPNSNMILWNAVAETDPLMTRRVNQRGGFTAIDSYYQIRRATELFGPLGQGWGYNADFRFENNLVIATVSIWYVWNGKRSESFTVCATNQLVATDKAGARHFIDEDAAKKALTDALTKGLSYLGFSADVFTGKFDDNRYVTSLNDRLRAQEREEELQVEIMELEDEMQLVIESVENAESYKRAREHLIPAFLRLKAIAPQLAVEYENAMVQLKRKYAEMPALSSSEHEATAHAKKRKTAAKGEPANQNSPAVEVVQ